MRYQIVWTNKETFIETDKGLISSSKFYQVIARLNQAKKLNAIRAMYGQSLLNEGKWATVEQRNQLAVIYSQK